MGARGIYLSQECHLVNLVPPVSVAGGKTSGVFNMKNHAHASIILQFGVTSAALKSVQVYSSDNGSPASTTAIPFNLHACETAYDAADGDVLGARQAIAATGFAPSDTDNIFYVVEVDADTLPAGENYVELVLTDESPAASSVLASAVVVLSGARYAEDQSDTVLT